MTRPKVDPDKRQRTAQACDSCKRRKQKCNGLQPCMTCSKRNNTCTYGDTENASEGQPSPKRRMMDVQDPVAAAALTASPQNELSQFNGQSSYLQDQQAPRWTLKPTGPPQIADHDLLHPKAATLGDDKKSILNPLDEPSELMSRGSTVSGQDEEAVVYSNKRMLEDPSGRLLYIGDSATLSFLQLIRMIVDTVAGPSSFTMDPRRHRIVDNTATLPANMRQTHLLPDMQTANVLVESFFANTNGLIEVFHYKSFLHTLQMCYADPLLVDPSWLCLLYLTFAIGLVLATPVPGTREEAIIRKLRSEPVDRAEVFYADAKHLKDPMAASGFEDGGFWSIQALTLMAVYMLAVSRRNAAYALHGMAVRSAFSLGLHREETMCIFSGAEQTVRRNLLRSLYVLDRFISTSLGRPITIQERDCSVDTLSTREKPPFPQAPFPMATNASYSSGVGLEAAVRSCHVIGVILDKVYSQRKISTKLAQEIADNCKGWPKSLDPSLHWKQANSANPTQGIAILHVNLFYCHSIVLLTRPFFLYLMNKTHQEQREHGRRPQRSGTRMEKFGEACVVASCQSIVLVQNARESRYLPHRNPFIIYFLFASAIVVLSNEFSGLFENTGATSCIENAISIMNYCAEYDPQASRLVFILTSFRDVVSRYRGSVSQNLLHRQSSTQHSSQPSAAEKGDPIGEFFPDDTSSGQPSSFPATSNSTDHPGRQRSNPSINSPHLLETLQPQTSSSPRNPPNGSLALRNGSITESNLGLSPTSLKQRSDSLDTFFDLARVSSNSVDNNDSLGEREIDFESLWQWPTSNATGLTPGGSSIGLTPGGSIGLVHGNGSGGRMAAVQIDVQGVSDSSVPLFGVSSAEFGGV